jgi:hypothetical protein
MPQLDVERTLSLLENELEAKPLKNNAATFVIANEFAIDIQDVVDVHGILFVMEGFLVIR